MSQEPLTIKELNVAIFHLEMQSRTQVWNNDIDGHNKTLEQIEEYKSKLQAVKNPYPYNEGDDYYTIEDTTGNPLANPIVKSCWDDQSEEMHNKDSKYFDSYEDAYQWMLEVADWDYHYSDDQRVWKQAKAWFELTRKARVMADESLEPMLKEIFDTVKQSNV